MNAPRDQQAAEWTRQLVLWWRLYNREYAGERLREPRLALVAGLAALGQWDAERRLLALRFEHVRDDPWQEAMATLRHEMAHQFADEVLLAHGESAHGPAFARACRLLRVEARASARGADPVAAAADDEAARLTRKISKLLALGSSPNQHEAASSMRLARALMLEHNLDVVEQDRARGYRRRTLGPVKARHAAFENSLGTILSEFYFVEVIWADDYDPPAGTSGTALFAYGTESNLELAGYVHAFLWELLPRLWEEQRRSLGLAGERNRLRYFEGVVSGLLERLREEERARLTQQRALVWRGDPRLSEYYRWFHPRIRQVRGAGRPVTEAYEAGQQAGRQVRIQRPIAERSSRFGGLLE
jgi:hypothetical protein